MAWHRLSMTASGVVLAAAVAAGGCGSTGVAGVGAKASEQLAALPDVPDAMIQMRRGGCVTEPCPVYSLAIFMDGTVIYDGRAHVATVGRRRAKLSAGQVGELVSAVDAMRFLDTAERCCICPETESYRSQMVVIDYRPGMAQKTVVHDDACRTAPPAMDALEQTIDRLANVTRWTAPVIATGSATPDQLR